MRRAHNVTMSQCAQVEPAMPQQRLVAQDGHEVPHEAAVVGGGVKATAALGPGNCHLSIPFKSFWKRGASHGLAVLELFPWHMAPLEGSASRRTRWWSCPGKRHKRLQRPRVKFRADVSQLKGHKPATCRPSPAFCIRKMWKKRNKVTST